MLNKIMLIGRFGRDPEMKYSEKGNPWTTFSMAVGHNGETQWFDCKCFNKTAEFVNEHGAKGRLAYVEGKMVCETWEKDGQTHKAWRVIVERLEFLDPKKVESPTE